MESSDFNIIEIDFAELNGSEHGELNEIEQGELNEIEQGELNEIEQGELNEIEQGEPNEIEQGELNENEYAAFNIFDVYNNEFGNIFIIEEIYDAKLWEIDHAVIHSSVCQRKYCEFKLCSLFKSNMTLLRNLLTSNELRSCVMPNSFMYCVEIHKHILCYDRNCHVPDCWDYKERRKVSLKIRDYYANENRDISKDYNNNDE